MTSRVKNFFKEQNPFVIISIILLIIFGLWQFLSPRDYNIWKYYKILDSQETDKTLSKTQINFDLSKLEICKLRGVGLDSDNCYLKYYENLTLKSGPIAALKHLSTLIQVDPSVVPGCHYISHGIGEGAYKYYGKNLDQAYALDVAKHFGNVGSCANGYFHGISIGLTRGAKNDDDLYRILKGFCESKVHQAGVGEDSCNHGLGHAVALYYDHDREKSIAMCERLSQGEKAFGCLTGVMMEYGIMLDYVGLSRPGKDGLMDLCKEFEVDTDRREACIVEGSGVMRRGENYVQAVKDCLTLDSRRDRKSCTKLTVIHSIRLGRSGEAKLLCNLIQEKGDRIECAAFMATYLALAVDFSRKEKYLQVIEDVCHALPFFEYLKCKSLSLNKESKFRSHINRSTVVSWHDIQTYFYGDKQYLNRRAGLKKADVPMLY